jgi:hypothetical protein
MKKLLTIMLVCLQIGAFAQSFWSKVIDDANYNKSIYKASSLFRDSLILVCGEVHSASCPGSGLFAYDLKGNRVWDKLVAFDLTATDSKFIYTAGYTIGTDDVGGDEQIVISKYNHQGTLVRQTEYPELHYSGYFYFLPTAMAVNESGAMVVSSKNSIIKVDSEGVVTSETRMTLQGDISGIQFIGNDSLLINTNSMLYKSDLAFTKLDSISFDENNVATVLRNDTIYCLFPHKLLVLNTKFKILDTLVTTNDIEFSKIRSFGGDLWVMGKQGEKAKLLQLHNSIVIDELTFDLLIQSPDFLVTPETVVFTGNSNSGQIAVCSFNRLVEPEPVNLPDIELIDFNIHDVGIDYWQTIPRGYSFDTDMTVRNNGKQAITSFAVYASLHGGINCANNFFYQKFTGVLIEPNQEKTFSLNRMYEENSKDNALCFECLAPNSMIETITGKNKLCQTVDFTGVEDIFDSNSICIFPNPVKDLLKIEFKESGTKQIRITGMDGRQVLETRISGAEANLDLSGLNAGIYLLSVGSAKGEWVEKIVKQ